MANVYSAMPPRTDAVRQGHPIRRRLISADARRNAPAQAQAHNDDHDLKLFALSFTAFFICIYTLIC